MFRRATKAGMQCPDKVNGIVEFTNQAASIDPRELLSQVHPNAAAILSPLNRILCVREVIGNA